MSHRVRRPNPRRLANLSVLLLCIGSLVLAACAAPVVPAPTLPPLADDQAAGRPGLPPLAPVALAAGEKLNVVATTNIVADVVARVGGDHISLTGLLPIGVDPHTYQPVPGDLRAVADADVVFVHGLGLEEFLEELIRHAGGSAPLVPVSAGVRVIAFTVEHDHEDEEEHAEHEGGDPHTWMNPRNIIIWVNNIAYALSRLDPANADAYQANADTYIAELDALDEWIRQQIARIPQANRQLVTDHAVFSYLAEEYGFTQVGAVVASFSLSVEPSAQELAQLQDRIRAFGVKAIFVGTTVNPRLAQQVASDTGVQLVRIYTDSLSAADGDAPTYLDFMRYNITAIVEALK